MSEKNTHPLIAFFQPQVGIGNEFQDAGPAVSFDVRPALDAMGEPVARQLKDNRESTDALAPADIVEAHRQQYGDEAAYYVFGVEDAVVEWFGPVEPA